MSEFSVLLLKEWRENMRNFKLLWIPLVFIIFGILEPVTNHFLPEILKSVGNMPEGTEFAWPEFRGEDIFYSLLGQYQFIGVLIIILAFMGSISGERKNGTATLLYVRPMSFSHYFLSKWIVVNVIVLVSLWIGLISAWYYIDILFNPVNTVEVLSFIATYSLWIVFIVTVVLTFSAWLSTGATAGLAIFVALILQIVDSIIGAYWTISPWKLSTYASFWFQPNPDMTNFWWSVLVTVIAIVMLIIFGIFMSKKNAAKTTV